MAVTIYDIAKESGVSIATVSKVINNKPGVSKKTIDKINQVIEEMNYRPNKAASSLSTKKSMTIGLIIPDISNPFYGEVSKQIEVAARHLNYGITICSSNTYDGEINRYIDVLLDSGVDGIIICSFIHKPQTLKKLKNLSIPIILLLTERRDEEYTTVNIDDHQTAYKITKALHEEGNKNIALLVESTLKNSSRIEGYARAMTDIGSIPNIVPMGFDSSQYERIIHQFFESTEQPATTICCSDLIAMHVARYCISNNIQIPARCQIISYGGIYLTEIYSPSITAIVEPLKEMSEYAVEAVIKSLDPNSSQSRTRVIYGTEFITRETTK